jgi:hypothetical protein
MGISTAEVKEGSNPPKMKEVAISKPQDPLPSLRLTGAPAAST